MHGIAHYNELDVLRAAQRKADAYVASATLQDYHKLPNRRFVHRADVMDGRCAMPFMGVDRSIALRSQRTLHRWDGKRPVQLRTFLAFDSWLYVVVMALFGIVFGLLSRFEWGRRQLLRHPKSFSGGVFSHEGPTQRTQQRSRFSITFRAVGWRCDEGGVMALGPLNRTVVTRVSGTNPGYGATCVAILLAAKIVLTEAKMVRGRYINIYYMYKSSRWYVLCYNNTQSFQSSWMQRRRCNAWSGIRQDQSD